MNLTDLTVLTCPFNFALADNVNQHLDNLVTDAIRATGALLIFLPTSPEWNPRFGGDWVAAGDAALTGAQNKKCSL